MSHFASGVDIQPLRATLDEVINLHSRRWEMENAAAAVEQLSAQLVSEGNVQQAKRMRKVAAKTRAAVCKKLSAEEAKMAGRLHLFR